MDGQRQIQIEAEQAREMTEAEVESIASLLFTWWRREFERERDEHKLSKDGEKL